MWETTAKDISDALQVNQPALKCFNRYKTVLKRNKKGAKDKNSTSGACRIWVVFEQELARINPIDDSIDPEVIRCVGEVIHKPAAPTSILQQTCGSANKIRRLHR